MNTFSELFSLYGSETDKIIRRHLAIVLRRKVKIMTNDDIVRKAPSQYLTPGEVDAGKTCGKITCIKMVRERTGMGLYDSKLLVEKWFSDHCYLFRS